MKKEQSIWLLLVSLGVGFFLFLPGRQTADAQPTGEYQVKAAYLYSFAKFVRWPAGILTSAADPIRLCVLNDAPFQAQLRRIAGKKQIDGHPVLVVPVQNGEQSRRCQELFIGSSENQDAAQIIESLRGTSVLTIGETQGFVKEGGMINFVLQGDHVRFEVNYKAATQAGLRMSSQLLNVAKVVFE